MGGRNPALETMGKRSLLVFTRESFCQGFLGDAGYATPQMLTKHVANGLRIETLRKCLQKAQQDEAGAQGGVLSGPRPFHTHLQKYTADVSKNCTRDG